MSTANDKDKDQSKLTDMFLCLEEISPLLFRSSNLLKPEVMRSVYGGHIVAQAMVAASNTIPKEREAHSLHCYFLKPGDVDTPILYEVHKTKDGLTYSNRFVRATQLGKTIFTMMVSFKETEADNYSHQFKMPDVPGPEELLDVNEILKQRLGNADISEMEKFFIEQILMAEVFMVFKPVDPRFVIRHENLPARQCMWLKAKGNVGDKQLLQKCVAAFMSDWQLLTTALLPGGDQVPFTDFISTTIDHSIWFHHDIKADEWLLYEMESPKCGQGRGHTVGRLWTRDGRLVMSVAQEGVVRIRPSYPESTQQSEAVSVSKDKGKSRL